jgi:hypothetical protein
MTRQIREAVVNKVGDMQACCRDASVGKPDLAGKVVFDLHDRSRAEVVTRSTSQGRKGRLQGRKVLGQEDQAGRCPRPGITIISTCRSDFKP